jgi:hypothetical protein
MSKVDGNANSLHAARSTPTFSPSTPRETSMKYRRRIAGLTVIGVGATAVTQLCNAGSAFAHFVHVLLTMNSP